MFRVRQVVPLVLAAALLVAGCAPACGRVCRKVLDDCGLDSERVAYDECLASCNQQEALYDDWENDRLRELFDDHKRCIVRSSCAEIADGACYQGYEDLFPFDPDKQITTTSAPTSR